MYKFSNQNKNKKIYIFLLNKNQIIKKKKKFIKIFYIFFIFLCKILI